MSNTSSESPETTTSSAADRTAAELDELTEILDETIAEGRRKLSGDGRIRDVDRERCRIRWATILIRATKARNELIETRDLIEMQEQINRLKSEGRW